MYVDAHPLAVDITDLQIQGFMQPKTACVNGGKIGFVLRGADRIEN